MKLGMLRNLSQLDQLSNRIFFATIPSPTYHPTAVSQGWYVDVPMASLEASTSKNM